MAIDLADVPLANDPSGSIVQLVWYNLDVSWSALIFFLIVYNLYSARRTQNKVGRKFKLCALLSVFFSFTLGTFDMLCASNLVVDWDYLSHSNFLTAVDSVALLLWVISKFTFYVAFQFHIEEYLSAYLQSVNLKILRIGFAIAAVLVLAGTIATVVIDAQTSTVDELLRVNSHVVLVNAVSMSSGVDYVDPVIVAVGDGVYFLCLTYVYMAVYGRAAGASSNSNSTQESAAADSSLKASKEIAKCANILMSVSTCFTVLAMIFLMTQWSGRILFIAIGVMVDDTCMLYLVYNSNADGNTYATASEDGDQAGNDETEALL